MSHENPREALSQRQAKIATRKEATRYANEKLESDSGTQSGQQYVDSLQPS